LDLCGGPFPVIGNYVDVTNAVMLARSIGGLYVLLYSARFCKRKDVSPKSRNIQTSSSGIEVSIIMIRYRIIYYKGIVCSKNRKTE